MKVVFSAEAKAGLREIAFHIAKENRGRAIGFVGDLRLKALAIAETPYAFPVVGRYAKRGVRRRIFHDCLIFYVVEDDVIRIVAVVHGARDLTTFLTDT